MHVPMHVLQDRFIYAVFKVHSAFQPLSFDSVLSRTRGPTVSPLYGDGGTRTLDPLLARQVLSQLSYTPVIHTEWA